MERPELQLKSLLSLIMTTCGAWMMPATTLTKLKSIGARFKNITSISGNMTFQLKLLRLLMI
ncbi:hypothetical protein IMAU10382_03091 [Lactiplantibacillus plantarum]|nr:hypothetical protein [Lactiplantibacillus plantarum]MCG0906358.1 hypothetical protein [Lactiplantibacillus plantarum]